MSGCLSRLFRRRTGSPWLRNRSRKGPEHQPLLSEYRYVRPSNYTATGAYVHEPRDAAQDHRRAAPSNYATYLRDPRDAFNTDVPLPVSPGKQQDWRVNNAAPGPGTAPLAPPLPSVIWRTRPPDNWTRAAAPPPPLSAPTQPPPPRTTQGHNWSTRANSEYSSQTTPLRPEFPENREIYRAYRHLGWLLGLDPQGPVHPPPLPLPSSPGAAAPARRQGLFSCCIQKIFPPRAQPPMPPDWAPRTTHHEATTRPPMGRRPAARVQTVPTVPRTSAAQMPPQLAQPRPATLPPGRESAHANTNTRPRRTNRPRVVRFASPPQFPPPAPTPKRARPSRRTPKTAVASPAPTPNPNPNVDEGRHPHHGCTACDLCAAQPLLAALPSPLPPRQQHVQPVRGPPAPPRRPAFSPISTAAYTPAQLACFSRFNQPWMNSRAVQFVRILAAKSQAGRVSKRTAWSSSRVTGTRNPASARTLSSGTKPAGITYGNVRVVSQRQSRTINSLETFVPQGIPSEQDPELAKGDQVREPRKDIHVLENMGAVELQERNCSSQAERDTIDSKPHVSTMRSISSRSRRGAVRRGKTGSPGPATSAENAARWAEIQQIRAASRESDELGDVKAVVKMENGQPLQAKMDTGKEVYAGFRGIPTSQSTGDISEQEVEELPGVRDRPTPKCTVGRHDHDGIGKPRSRPEDPGEFIYIPQVLTIATKLHYAIVQQAEGS
ncbi:hypothetical protein B0H14DRAFT_3156227 [Mycena olivaceomarginata]|nr:hypothetical protein B0H14DRAFT_3156227 [Mycena olivaceomarginata]